MKKNKKAQTYTIGDLSKIGVSLVVLAIILGIGGMIVTNIRDSNLPSGFNISDPSTFDTAYNVTSQGAVGVNTLASYIPTVALVVVAAVVVGIVLMYFARRK